MSVRRNPRECLTSRLVNARDAGISDSNFRRLAKLAVIFAVVLLAIAAQPAPKKSAAIQKERYLSPIEVAISPDGRLLYVVCQDSDEVRVIDSVSGEVIKIVPVGHIPRGIALASDGSRLYVTNAWSDTVSVIDTKTLEVVQTLPTGPEPSGVVLEFRETPSTSPIVSAVTSP